MDIGLLLLIVFILAPLLEKLLGAGRPKAPPQQGPPQRGPQRVPRRQQPSELEERPFRTIPPADADADEQSAAAMLPDDLWEILTGEKRPPRVDPVPPPRAEGVPAERAPFEVATPRREPRPRPAPPEPVPERARRPDREARRAERQPPLRRTPAPPRERRLPEVTMRRDPSEGRMRPAAPRDSSPPDDYVREIPVREVPAVVPFDTPSADPLERRAEFHGRRGPLSEPATVQRSGKRGTRVSRDVAELRRAIIMNEILGRPKGLE